MVQISQSPGNISRGSVAPGPEHGGEISGLAIDNGVGGTYN